MRMIQAAAVSDPRIRCSVVGALVFGVSVMSRCAPVSPGIFGRPRIDSVAVALSCSAFPDSGENLMVASEPATPPPKDATIRHWLRSMFRWCGIILDDQGVGLFKRSR